MDIVNYILSIDILTKFKSEEIIVDIAGVFYNVKNGSSFLTSKSSSVVITNTCAFVVFKTKRELKCQNELFLNIIKSICFDY